MLLVLIAKACSSSLAAYHHEVTACSVFLFSNSTVSDFDFDQIGFCFWPPKAFGTASSKSCSLHARLYPS